MDRDALSPQALPKPLAIYALESYLLDTVSGRFQDEGSLGAFDLFCIVIWKANRAKSHVARRLKLKFGDDLEVASRAFTKGIAQARSPGERLSFVTDTVGFRLPMASAVLTILFPEEFTVYDTRVCERLGDYGWLANRSGDALLEGYRDFVAAVRSAVPAGLSLRDCDRWLWGESFAASLQRDIAYGFVQGS
jgi:hypothetical protein